MLEHFPLESFQEIYIKVQKIIEEKYLNKPLSQVDIDDIQFMAMSIERLVILKTLEDLIIHREIDKDNEIKAFNNIAKKALEQFRILAIKENLPLITVI